MLETFSIFIAVLAVDAILLAIVVLIHIRLRKLKRERIAQSNPLVPSPRPANAGTKR